MNKHFLFSPIEEIQIVLINFTKASFHNYTTEIREKYAALQGFISWLLLTLDFQNYNFGIYGEKSIISLIISRPEKKIWREVLD